MPEKICLTKVYEFFSAHRLNCKKLSKEENLKIFGKCNNFQGHGHNYILEVTVTGKINPKTGMLIDLRNLDNIVNEVLKKLNYKRLDIEVKYFQDIPPSGENIIQYLWKNLEKKIKPTQLYKLKLWETRDNYFEYREKSVSGN